MYLVEFDILGPLRVRTTEAEVSIRSARQRLLLALLVIEAGTPVSVPRLIEEIWADRAPATATAALQVHASALRKIVGDRLRWTPAGYLLDVPAEAVDAGRFQAAVAAALPRVAAAHPDLDAVEVLRAADRWWHGPALADVPDSATVRIERTRLADLRRRVLHERCVAQLALGRHDEVVADLTPLVAAQPTAEPLVMVLMRALHRAGRSADAHAVHERAVHALRDEVGAAPSPELTALAEAVARRDPVLDFAPPSVPVPVTRFVGRRAELDRLGEVLGTTRLLTLTGPGGVGKTRLAMQICRERGADHPHGITWADLSAVTGPAAVLPRIGDALGIRADGDVPLREIVVEHLRTGSQLLVLDNCEHLLEPCAELAVLLLGRCPALRVLTTSRSPLDLPGETVWPVAGLSLRGAADSDAVRLLAARARDVRRDFRLAGADVTVARDLCARLDGLPLAIEMIAAQLRAMSLREVAARLVDRLDLRAARAATPRHRTLRTAIAWGHDLLPAAERVAFRRLAVFAGGFTREAVEQVVADPRGDPPNTAQQASAALSRLVESSFVTALVARGDAATRYTVLETVRDYAVEQLVAAPAGDAARQRHVAWCRDLAARSAEFGGELHGRHLTLLRAEQANLRAALRWCLRPDGDAEMALSIASSLWWFWWLTGQLPEGRRWLERALAATAGQPPARRGSALRAVAALARSAHDFDAARRWGEEALAAAHQVGEPLPLARALNGLCMTANAQHDLDASLRFGRESRRQAEAAGDARNIAAATNNVGVTLRCLGRIDEAADHFTEALDRFVAARDRRGEAAALGNLAIVARRRGQLADSRALCLRSLRLYHDLELREGEADVAEAIACLEVTEGRPERAVRLLAAADVARRELGAAVFTPDEIVDRDRAAAAARAALGERADEVAPTPLADLVTELLAT